MMGYTGIFPAQPRLKVRFNLKLINQRPTLLSADLFYVMSQAVMPKYSPEEISLRGVLKVGGLLVSIGVNDNKIISGITNGISIPSRIWYVVKKVCDATL